MYLLLLFTLVLPVHLTPADSLPRGTVVDTVHIPGSPKYSYALYLPSNYSPDKKWPVIFGLDPIARGKKPVDVFKEVAEQYGYILAGSNNSRNGPVSKALPSVIAMINDVGEKFTIDKNRIYLAGFSGGSRLASFIAFRYPSIRGIIACGAGLMPTLHLNDRLHFSYVSTVGMADMNYLEMKDLDEDMTDTNIPHHLIIFNGTHQWADSVSAREAVQWLQLDAMRRNLTAVDTLFILRFYASQIKKVNYYENEKRYAEAYRNLKQIPRDFGSFSFINQKSVQQRIKKLGRSRALRADQKKEQKLANMEVDRLQMFEKALKTILNVRFDRTYELKSSGWWKKQIGEVQDLKQSKDSAYVLLGKRLDQYLKAQIYEYQRQINDYWHDYHRLVWMDQVWVLLYPKSNRVRYQLARSLILDKQVKEGIAALREAIDLGYNDYHNLKTNPDFKSVRDNPEFQKILKKMEPAG